MFEPFLGEHSRLALLPGAGLPARVACRQPLQLHLRVGAQQVRGHLLLVDAQGEVQRVIDDVLGEIETRVEDVVGGDPAYLRAIGGGALVPADGVPFQLFQLLRPEQPRPATAHLETHARHAAREEAHTRSLLQVESSKSKVQSKKTGRKGNGGRAG